MQFFMNLKIDINFDKHFLFAYANYFMSLVYTNKLKSVSYFEPLFSPFFQILKNTFTGFVSWQMPKL